MDISLLPQAEIASHVGLS